MYVCVFGSIGDDPAAVLRLALIGLMSEAIFRIKFAMYMQLHRIRRSLCNRCATELTLAAVVSENIPWTLVAPSTGYINIESREITDKQLRPTPSGRSRDW